MLFRLAFPKYVILTNTRLSILYNLAVVIVLVLVTTWCAMETPWTSSTIITDKMTLATWTDDEAIARNIYAARPKKLLEPVCNGSNIYDYGAKSEGVQTSVWSFTNFTCPAMCLAQGSPHNCLTTKEVIQHIPSGMFFATAIRETTLKLVNSSPKTIRHSHYFFPFEDAFHFSFSFGFRIPHSDVRHSRNLFLAKEMAGSSMHDVGIVVYDSNNVQWKTFQPSSVGFNFTIRELLFLAGRSDWLDAIQQDLGRNTLPNAHHPGGPVGRLTGIRLQCHLSCFAPGGSITVGSWKGRVCKMHVVSLGNAWSVQHRMWQPHEPTTMRSYHGVQVDFKTEVAAQNLDLSYLLSALTSAVVLITLPAKCFRVFAVKFLGHLSDIYRSALDERFSITQSVASLAMNLMTASSAFQKLTDGGGGISLKRMEHLIKFSLSDCPDLDDHEIHAFCLFCFVVAHDIRAGKFTNAYSGGFEMSLAMLKRFTSGVLWSNEEHTGTPSLGRSGTMIFNQFIDKSAFMNSTFISSKLALNDVVKLFDRDRKTSFLEEIFLPSFVKGEIDKERYLESRMTLETKETEEKMEQRMGTDTPSDTREERKADTSPREHTHPVTSSLARDSTLEEEMHAQMHGLQRKVNELEGLVASCCQQSGARISELSSSLKVTENRVDQLEQLHSAMEERMETSLFQQLSANLAVVFDEKLVHSKRQGFDANRQGSPEERQGSSEEQQESVKDQDECQGTLKSTENVPVRTERGDASPSFSNWFADSVQLRLDTQDMKLQACMDLLNSFARRETIRMTNNDLSSSGMYPLVDNAGNTKMAEPGTTTAPLHTVWHTAKLSAAELRLAADSCETPVSVDEKKEKCIVRSLPYSASGPVYAGQTLSLDASTPRGNLPGGSLLNCNTIRRMV